jgi:hypothetical protein
MQSPRRTYGWGLPGLSPTEMLTFKVANCLKQCLLAVNAVAFVALQYINTLTLMLQMGYKYTPKPIYIYCQFITAWSKQWCFGGFKVCLRSLTNVSAHQIRLGRHLRVRSWIMNTEYFLLINRSGLRHGKLRANVASTRIARWRRQNRKYI